MAESREESAVAEQMCCRLEKLLLLVLVVGCLKVVLLVVCMGWPPERLRLYLASGRAVY